LTTVLQSWLGCLPFEARLRFPWSVACLESRQSWSPGVGFCPAASFPSLSFPCSHILLLFLHPSTHKFRPSFTQPSSSNHTPNTTNTQVLSIFTHRLLCRSHFLGLQSRTITPDTGRPCSLPLRFPHQSPPHLST
jgi:hypothetical protein